MTPTMWKMLTWTALALSLTAHFFLIVDAGNINSLKDRVTELERVQ